MKTTHNVEKVGMANYMRYKRAKVLNMYRYANLITDTIEPFIKDKDFRKLNSFLKDKLPSYYISKHEGFKSLAEQWNEKGIVRLSEETSKARRETDVKPGSWFKVEDAYSILESIKKEYDIKKILDPFNGWGARAAGALCLDLEYKGIDLNPLLQNELKDIFKNNEKVSFENENSFEYDFSKLNGYDCVFTCPPYWKAEDYGYRGQFNGTYESFISELAKLSMNMFKINGMKIVIMSIEDFRVKGKKYSFVEDYKKAILEKGLECQEIVYSRIKRNFQKDERDLAYIKVIKNNI